MNKQKHIPKRDPKSTVPNLVEHIQTVSKNTAFKNNIGNLSRLWNVFTKNRGSELGQYFKDPKLRTAYVSYYTPLYAQKIAALLERLDKEGHFPANFKKDVKLLDLGAGPLSATIGVMSYFEDAISNVLAVDREIAPMQLGKSLIESHNKNVALKLVKENILHVRTWKQQLAFKPNLIVLAHVINEIAAHKKDMVTLLLQQLSAMMDDGYILIVEPATKESSRALMQLRDEIMQEIPDVQILAPCVGSTFCPMFKNATNWCHADFAFGAERSDETIDKALGFDRTTVKTSYLLLSTSKHPSTLHSSTPQKNLRIVSGRMCANGTNRRYACSSEGIVTLVEDKKQSNSLEHFWRGEIVDKAQLGKNIAITREQNDVGAKWRKNRRTERAETSQGARRRPISKK